MSFYYDKVKVTSKTEFDARRYMGTSLIRKRPPLGPYSRPMPTALW